MIRTYLELNVQEGRADDLAELFRRLKILETSAAQPGCQSAELTVSEDGRQLIVTALWDDLAAYDRWTNRSDRGEQAAELNALLTEPIGASTIGGKYRVAWHATATENKIDNEGVTG